VDHYLELHLSDLDLIPVLEILLSPLSKVRMNSGLGEDMMSALLSPFLRSLAGKMLVKQKNL
jgi:hypothetical protein